MKKIVAIVLTVCMVFAALAMTGCGSSSSKGSVYWLNFKPESDAVLQDVAALYTKNTGVEVKVVTAASGTYFETLTAEMDKSGAPTLFVVGNTEAVKT